jgi:hypothetical protein
MRVTSVGSGQPASRTHPYAHRKHQPSARSRAPSWRRHRVATDDRCRDRLASRVERRQPEEPLCRCTHPAVLRRSSPCLQGRRRRRGVQPVSQRRQGSRYAPREPARTRPGTRHRTPARGRRRPPEVTGRHRGADHTGQEPGPQQRRPGAVGADPGHDREPGDGEHHEVDDSERDQCRSRLPPCHARRPVPARPDRQDRTRVGRTRSAGTTAAAPDRGGGASHRGA